jgi:SnoaL-like polyketide cyclase
MNAKTVVQQHLRALEAGEWEGAAAYIANDYRFSGVIPFPISLFVKIGKKDALRMHQARKQALPDFKFNETYQEESDTHVKIQVTLSGTHTGVIDYRGILRGIPVVQPTGKVVKLNPEWFVYHVSDGLIYKTIATIPKNAGVSGLVKAVTESAGNPRSG